MRNISALSLFENVKTFIGFTRLPILISRFSAFRKVAIICYHKPNYALFEKHLRWLFQHHFTPISMDQLQTAVHQQDANLLPRYPVVITMDDGWRENMGLLPLIEKYKVPVLIFLTASIVGTSRRFWWLVVQEQNGNDQLLKRLPYTEFIDVLRNQYGYEFDRNYPEPCALSWEEIHVLQKNNLVSFGSHSCTHPILTQCPDDILKYEIDESKKLLEERLQAPVIHFAFPNGSTAVRERQMLQAAGYMTGRSTKEGWVNIRTAVEPFDLPVIRGADHDSVFQFSYAISGLDVARKLIMRGFQR